MKVDLGCGASKKAGFRGVDRLPLPGVDVIHDLDSFPYPFSDASVDEIWCEHVIEHMKEPVLMLEEMYRMCKPGALITITVPYFRSFYAAIDPTHRNFYSAQTFNYFDPRHELCKRFQYSKAQFHIERIEFDREFKVKPLRWFHSWLIRYAEKNPVRYEARFSQLIPLHTLTFYLRRV